MSNFSESEVGQALSESVDTISNDIDNVRAELTSIVRILGVLCDVLAHHTGYPGGLKREAMIERAIDGEL